MNRRHLALALWLAPAAPVQAQSTIFTLDGEIVRQARIASFCAEGGSHCGAQFSGGRYGEATCQWTAEPDIALCLFVIDYPDGRGEPNRQRMRRVGVGWRAVWR